MKTVSIHSSILEPIHWNEWNINQYWLLFIGLNVSKHSCCWDSVHYIFQENCFSPNQLRPSVFQETQTGESWYRIDSVVYTDFITTKSICQEYLGVTHKGVTTKSIWQVYIVWIGTVEAVMSRAVSIGSYSMKNVSSLIPGLIPNGWKLKLSCEDFLYEQSLLHKANK